MDGNEEVVRTSKDLSCRNDDALGSIGGDGWSTVVYTWGMNCSVRIMPVSAQEHGATANPSPRLAIYERLKLICLCQCILVGVLIDHIDRLPLLHFPW